MIREGKAGRHNKTQKEFIDNAYEGTERMIRLISDMLDVTRIEQRALGLKKTSFTLNDLVREVIEELSVRASQIGVRLFLEKGMPQVTVKADWDKVSEIFINLIGNALKYTRKGGKIAVNFKVSGNEVECCVTDTGVGISKSEIPKLFKKFGRLDSSFTKAAEAGGTGLGLYISK